MKVPSPGESITEVQISRWLKKDGDYVEKDEEICEIDSDKATLTLSAEASGVLKIMAKEGDTIAVGTIVCSIDDKAETPAKTEKPAATDKKEEKKEEKNEKVKSKENVQPVAAKPAEVKTEKKQEANKPYAE